MDEYKKQFTEMVKNAQGDWFINDQQRLVLFRWMAATAGLAASELECEQSENRTTD